MVRYLTETDLAKPQVGLKVGFAEGSLMFRDAAGNIVRVPWESTGQKGVPKGKLAVPEGEYTLTSYRIVDRSREGEVWHVSATAKSIQEVSVVAGETVKVELDKTVHVKQRFKRGSIGMTITGMSAAGLSIYKNGKRIPMGWKLVTEKDEAVIHGKINYG